jgi:ABC-type glycerol-3-phosphate transport system substrate-binding protein
LDRLEKRAPNPPLQKAHRIKTAFQKGARQMRSLMTIVVIIILGLSLSSCGNVPGTNAEPQHAKTITNKVDDEASARQIVDKYIKTNGIDVSGLEFYFARQMDTTGKRTSLPDSFGTDIWIVKYGLKRRPNELMTLGSGILFWVDARTGKTVMRRERD